MNIQQAIRAVAERTDLSSEEMRSVMKQIMTGDATPAQIGGFEQHGQRLAEGGTANLVVFDPTAEWVAVDSLSKSRNAPYLGRTLQGRVVATMLRGSVTWRA